MRQLRAMIRFVLSTSVVAASLMCLNASPGHAQTFGDAPWCAVVNVGAGEIQWDCEYRTVQECTPNVLAGNRGFCNVNPYWRPPQARPVSVVHRKRHNQHQ
jgi:hypothetical protein